MGEEAAAIMCQGTTHPVTPGPMSCVIFHITYWFRYGEPLLNLALVSSTAHRNGISLLVYLVQLKR